VGVHQHTWLVHVGTGGETQEKKVLSHQSVDINNDVHITCRPLLYSDRWYIYIYIYIIQLYSDKWYIYIRIKIEKEM
jgi:hypothetical protein